MHPVKTALGTLSAGDVPVSHGFFSIQRIQPDSVRTLQDDDRGPFVLVHLIHDTRIAGSILQIVCVSYSVPHFLFHTAKSFNWVFNRAIASNKYFFTVPSPHFIISAISLNL